MNLNYCIFRSGNPYNPHYLTQTDHIMKWKNNRNGIRVIEELISPSVMSG